MRVEKVPPGQDEGECVTCDNKPTLEQVLAAQPLNPFRLLEFRPLPLNEHIKQTS